MERLAAEVAGLRAALKSRSPRGATSDESRRIGIADVRARLGVSNNTVAAWAARGKFPAPHYINGLRRWWLGEVEQWEREHVTTDSGVGDATRKRLANRR